MTGSTAVSSVNTSGSIKIIGIGQSLRGDDRAGLAAVRMWQERYKPGTSQMEIEVELAELPGMQLLQLIEGAGTAILVDAVRSGAKPGTIHLLTGDQLASFSAGSGSAHGWGVAETLALGQQLMPAAIPQKLILVGIEAGDVSPGEHLSPEVEQAIPEAARLIDQLVRAG